MIYQITLDNSDGQRLGLELDASNGRTLLVTSIMGGLVQEWNDAAHEASVAVGDSIIAVNSSHDSSAWLLQEIQQQRVLSITLVNIEASETQEICMCISGLGQVDSQEAGRYQIALDQTGRQRLGLELDGSNGRTLLIRSIFGGLGQEWNNQHEDQCICVGDAIIAVNSIHGDSGVLLREIHHNQSLSLVLDSNPADDGMPDSPAAFADCFDASARSVAIPAPPADVPVFIAPDKVQVLVASRWRQEVLASAEEYPFLIVTVAQLGSRQGAFRRLVGTEEQQRRLNVYVDSLAFPHSDEYEHLARGHPERRPACFIFHGPRGCGKTAHAYELARSIGVPMIVFTSQTARDLDAGGQTTLQRAFLLACQEFKSALILLEDADFLAREAPGCLSEVGQAIEGVPRLEMGCCVIVVATTNRPLSELPVDFVQNATEIIRFDELNDRESLRQFWRKNARSVDFQMPEDGEDCFNVNRDEMGRAIHVPKQDAPLTVRDSAYMHLYQEEISDEGLAGPGLPGGPGALRRFLSGSSAPSSSTHLFRGIHSARKGIVTYLVEDSSGCVWIVPRWHVECQGSNLCLAVLHGESDLDLAPTLLTYRSDEDYDQLADASMGLPQRMLVRCAQWVLQDHVTRLSARHPGNLRWPFEFEGGKDPSLSMYLQALERCKIENSLHQRGSPEIENALHQHGSQERIDPALPRHVGSALTDNIATRETLTAIRDIARNAAEGHLVQIAQLEEANRTARMQVEAEKMMKAALLQEHEAVVQLGEEQRSAWAIREKALEVRLQLCEQGAEQEQQYLQEHARVAALAQAEVFQEQEAWASHMREQSQRVQRELEEQGSRMTELEEACRREREQCAQQVFDAYAARTTLERECAQVAASRDRMRHECEELQSQLAASRDHMQHECEQLRVRLTDIEAASRRQAEDQLQIEAISRAERERESERQHAQLLRSEQKQHQIEAVLVSIQAERAQLVSELQELREKHEELIQARLPGDDTWLHEDMSAQSSNEFDDPSHQGVDDVVSAEVVDATISSSGRPWNQLPSCGTWVMRAPMLEEGDEEEEVQEALRADSALAAQSSQPSTWRPPCSYRTCAAMLFLHNIFSV